MLVKELREAERKRESIFETIETFGKKTHNLPDLMERLGVYRERVKNLEYDLNELETRQAPDYRLVDIDPDLAVETIQRVIRACPDPKQLRLLMGTFVQKITVSNASVIVEYREDALLRSPTPTVHSGVRWLPALGSNHDSKSRFNNARASD